MSDDFFYRPPGPKRPPRARPLSAHAQARLEALTYPLPEKGDRITIRWPGGPYDFVLDFEYEDIDGATPPPGWHYLHGVIVEPVGWHPRVWSPMVHLVDGEWSLLPKGGKLSDL